MKPMSEYLRGASREETGHPIAKIGAGVLALGAGALLARKLWKRRQQQKQQKTTG